LSVLYYILTLCILIRVFYMLFFYLRILRYEVPLKQKELPAVSVIICAHNELENLKKIVPAILQQQYEAFELIIANDRSDDGSEEYLRKEFGQDSRLRIIKIEGNSKGKNYKKYALTKAIESAQYNTLLFTDADCLPLSSLWIEEMSSALASGSEKEIVVGYSPYQYQKGLLNLLIRYETLYTAIHYFSFALAGIPYMGVGRNLMYKKSVFVKNRGFESHMNRTGGDDDLFMKEVANQHNTAICFKKEAQVVSWPKKDYFSWIRQKRRHLSVGSLYNGRVKLLLGLQMFVHILYYVGLFGLFLVDYKAAFLFLMIHGLVFVVIFTLIARKLEDNYGWWAWLLLPIDIIYIFSYLVITLSLLIDKKIKWS
jgi:glycosyltransferase involved in cell wall biosynthesis